MADHDGLVDKNTVSHWQHIEKVEKLKMTKANVPSYVAPIIQAIAKAKRVPIYLVWCELVEDLVIKNSYYLKDVDSLLKTAHVEYEKMYAAAKQRRINSLIIKKRIMRNASYMRSIQPSLYKAGYSLFGRDRMRYLAAEGVDREWIAKEFGVTKNTLKHILYYTAVYKRDLTRGKLVIRSPRFNYKVYRYYHGVKFYALSKKQDRPYKEPSKIVTIKGARYVYPIQFQNYCKAKRLSEGGE